METLSLGGPRTVDELGRVVLPLEVRAILGLTAKSRVLFIVHDGRIEVQRADAGGGHVRDNAAEG